MSTSPCTTRTLRATKSRTSLAALSAPFASTVVLGLALTAIACGSAASSDSLANGGNPNGAPGAGNGEGPSLDPGGGSGASAGNGDRGPSCQTLDVVARPENADILIALDRSGSMAGERWTVASTAVTGAVAAREGDARFGIALFPAVGEELSCRPGPVSVMPQKGAASAIRAVVQAPEAIARVDNGYTPTRVTLERAFETLSAAKAAGNTAPAYVLLVTDGRPNCPAVGEKFAPDEQATYAALDRLLAAGIKTFVVGYLTDEFKLVMDEMARHGGTQKHYAVADAQALVTAIQGVTNVVAPCTFDLDTAPPGVEYVRVRVDGTDVPYSGTTGFSIDGGKRVVLNGAACERMRDGGEHAVKITVECTAVRPK